jgi:hypothetical protein
MKKSELRKLIKGIIQEQRFTQPSHLAPKDCCRHVQKMVNQITSWAGASGWMSTNYNQSTTNNDWQELDDLMALHLQEMGC